jgi:hypothetical protein
MSAIFSPYSLVVSLENWHSADSTKGLWACRRYDSRFTTIYDRAKGFSGVWSITYVLGVDFGSLRRSLGIVRLEYLQGPTSHAAAYINQDDLSATPVSQSLTMNHPRTVLYKVHIPDSHLTFCNAEQDLIRYPGGDGGAWGMARACRL